MIKLVLFTSLGISSTGLSITCRYSRIVLHTNQSAKHMTSKVHNDQQCDPPFQFLYCCDVYGYSCYP